MGAAESSAGGLLQRMLMPAPGEADWYAGRRRQADFPKAHENSLLLLGHVRLAVPSADAAKQFYVEGLGAGTCQQDDGKPVRVSAGATAFELPVVAAKADHAPGVTWPGQFYVWVEDIKKTLSACEDLAKRLGKQVDDIVEEVHHVTAEHAIDAILIRDPVGENLFLVNQAPTKLVEKMRFARAGSKEGEAPNFLAVIDAAHAVPKGAAPGVARFYSHFLGAAVTKKDAGSCSGPGYSVHFSFGDVLRQTLTFLEEGEAGQVEADGICEVCLYMPSEEKFQVAFTRCSDAGLVEGPAQSWDEVKEAKQFMVRRCYDPNTQSAQVTLEHVIRHPQHADLPTIISTPALAQEV